MRRIRIAAHAHSTWSYDGEWTLDQVAATLRRRGYDAVLMAEHDRTFDAHRWADYTAACAAASRAGILLVPGIEYEDPDNVVHVPVWGDDLPFLGAGRPTLEILQTVRERGGVALLAHPERRTTLERFRAEWAPLLAGVEIWNRKTDGLAPSRASLRLAAEHGLAPYVSLDLHNARQLLPLAMTLTVEGPLSAPQVVSAVREGRLRPEAFGRPASGFAHGPRGASMRALEDLRRSLRAPARRRARRAAAR